MSGLRKLMPIYACPRFVRRKKVGPLSGTVYESLGEALAAARENQVARNALAKRGPGYVMVAEVRTWAPESSCRQ
jgi:hypothetical protein